MSDERIEAVAQALWDHNQRGWQNTVPWKYAGQEAATGFRSDAAVAVEVLDRLRDAPRQEGDVTVIGPECFASDDGSVLCWRGQNYVPQSPQGEDHEGAPVSDERIEGESGKR